MRLPEDNSVVSEQVAMRHNVPFATGKWKGEGVFNMEDFDPAPFMDALNQYGLPWQEVFEPVQEV